MSKFNKLKQLREQIVLLPGLRTYKDFDIAIEIGHQELLGKPVTQKQLLLSQIASPATVRRHLGRLIKSGLVLRSVSPENRRVVYFLLSPKAHNLFDSCLKQLQGMLER